MMGFRHGGRHLASGDLLNPGPLRRVRRPWHDGLNRSRRGNDRHPFHAAHDGFARTAEGIHGLLAAGRAVAQSRRQFDQEAGRELRSQAMPAFGPLSGPGD